jgi:hypothetical protein
MDLTDWPFVFASFDPLLPPGGIRIRATFFYYLLCFDLRSSAGPLRCELRYGVPIGAPSDNPIRCGAIARARSVIDK